MSENISEALAYAVELREKQEVIFKEEGKTFYDTSKASLRELFPKKYAGTLEVNSLTGLIQYLQSMFDQDADKPASLIIHVESPTKVSVLGKLDEERRRESLIAATAELDVFPYKNFLDQERFKINMMALFDRTDDAEAILAFASAIRLEGSSDLRDDGISQMATVKTGTSTVGDGVVPSPAVLKPYRTFLEVDQPESSFIFRINDRGDCALFEADGGLWKSTAYCQGFC
ncbi:hypothetical protein [Enterococcus alishanensis]|uniref:hypothetical protein n=1 Tax=Enterococcus alishanensis TaxID=1303817 RepID=UPI001FE33ADB|nr:hypothetical protein [Enterococcus alishanensis]